MKRLLMALGFMTLGSSVWGAGNQVGLTVSSGTYQAISTYANNDGANRQAIVIGDATSSTTLTVDSIKGIPVYVSTGTSQIGSVNIMQPTVLGATVTYNGTQSVDVGTFHQSTVVGSTVTFNGTQNVQLQTGANAIGSITNTSFAISTGGVTATQGGTWTVQPGNTANTTPWNNYTTNPTTAPIQVQNAAGSLLGVGYQSGGSSIPVNVLNTVAISGSITSSSVNITTATPNTALPTAAQFIAGVGPTGLTQSFRVSADSAIFVNISTSIAVPITGSVNAVGVNITTGSINGTFPTTGSALIFVGPTGLGQSPQVDISSNVKVSIMQPTVLGATVTYNGTQSVDVGTFHQSTVIGATVTYNGTQSVNVANLNGQTTSYVMNVTTSPVMVLVSSAATLPTATANAGQAQMMGDIYGRIFNAGPCPLSAVKTSTATLTTTTSEIVFISSGGSNIHNNLIGCIGENTSSTAADITFRQQGPSGFAAGSFPFGMSVSNVPVGFFPPGGIPQSYENTNWTIQGSASVTSLKVTCWYCPL